MHSLKSRGYVTETFSWQWYYWYLTNEGITYLREYLAVPEDVVPATLKKPRVNPTRPTSSRREGGFRRERDDDKKTGAPGDYKPGFRSGAPRGERSEGSREGGDRPRGAGSFRGGRGGAPRSAAAPSQ